MQKDSFSKYFLNKYLEETPSFDDLNEDWKNDFFYKIIDFVELVSKHSLKTSHYYNFLIEKRYTSIDITMFENVILKFLQSECSSADHVLVRDARKAFDDYRRMLPDSLLQFRRQLLRIYYENRFENEFFRSRFVNLLHGVPETKLSLENLHQEMKQNQHESFETRFEKFIEITQLPKSARIASENFVQGLQAILDESCLSPLKPKVHIFGSIISGLVNYSADIDIFISFECTRKAQFKLDFTTSTFLLNFLAQVLFGRDFVQVFANRATILELRRAPIIKIDPKIYNENVGIDISVTSKYALHNSRMLKSLSRYDDRFPKLVLLLKFWAKRVELVRQEAISSYCFTLIVLFFCQQQKILPPVEILTNIVCEKYNLKSNIQTLTVFSFTEETMFDITVEEIDSRFQKNNQLPIEKLIVLFFEFYAGFPFTNYIICPRTGGFENRERIINIRKNDKYVYEHFQPGEIIIEDPLHVQHNVAGPRLRIKKLVEFFTYMLGRIHLYKDSILDILLLEKCKKFRS